MNTEQSPEGKGSIAIVFFVVVAFVLLILIAPYSKNEEFKKNKGTYKEAEQDIKYIKARHEGLYRRIILYDSNGQPIRRWEGKYYFVSRPPVISFIHKGRSIAISGTFIIEEVPEYGESNGLEEKGKKNYNEDRNTNKLPGVPSRP